MDKDKLIQSVSNDQEIGFYDLISLFVKRKKIILSVMACFLIGAVVYLIITPQKYRASASIAIMPIEIQSPLSTIGISTQSHRISRRSILPHTAFLKSTDLMEAVYEEFKKIFPDAKGYSPESIDYMLSVGSSRDQSMLSLTAATTSPEEARELVNLWANLYLQYQESFLTSQVMTAGNFIEHQVVISRNDLEEKEKIFSDFNKEFSVSDTKRELDILGELFTTYSRSVLNLTIDIVFLESYITNQKEGSKDKEFYISSLKTFTTLPDPGRLFFADSEAVLSALKDKRSFLESRTEDIKIKHDELKEIYHEIRTKHLRLERELDLARKTYALIASKYDEAKIAKALQFGEIRIISTAYLPKKPYSPRYIQTLILILIFSFVAGLFIAFCQEHFLTKEKS